MIEYIFTSLLKRCEHCELQFSDSCVLIRKKNQNDLQEPPQSDNLYSQLFEEKVKSQFHTNSHSDGTLR